jgi:large subunit ribosomal protein L20
MEGLKAANVDLDRKSLAELAVANPEAFKAVFELAKKAIDAKEGATLKA